MSKYRFQDAIRELSNCNADAAELLDEVSDDMNEFVTNLICMTDGLSVIWTAMTLQVPVNTKELNALSAIIQRGEELVKDIIRIGNRIIEASNANPNPKEKEDAKND